MNKLFLIISVLIVSMIVILTIIFANKNNLTKKFENNSTTQSENNLLIENTNEVNNNSNNDNTPKYLESLLDIPIPDSIIFYNNNIQKEFINGTTEFNEIISLNTKRDSGKLATGALELVVDINNLLKNNNMLEYKYKNYEPIYFTLISDKELSKDYTKINWVSIGYDSKVFKQFIYAGLTSADNLINYLETQKSQ